MPRLLLIAVVLAAVVATTAGMAWAHGGSAPAMHRVGTRAPLSVPRVPPRPDAAQPGVLAYRSSAQIAATMSAAATPSSDTTTAPGSASITVTAVVLPTITLQLDAHRHLQSIVANTPVRDANAVVFSVRSIDGASRPITPALWASARRALAHSRAGMGTIWSR